MSYILRSVESFSKINKKEMKKKLKERKREKRQEINLNKITQVKGELSHEYCFFKLFT